MTTSPFINPGLSTEHRGADRLEAAGHIALRLGRQFKGSKGLVAMLLAGALSALVVVADQIVGTWADGHLLMAWIALWAMVFLALALFAEATRGWTDKVAAAWSAYRRASARRADDRSLWAMAEADPRVMAEIDAARLRAEHDGSSAGSPAWPASRYTRQYILAHSWC